jgi:hypothetical protein
MDGCRMLPKSDMDIKGSGDVSDRRGLYNTYNISGGRGTGCGEPSYVANG